jgi:hypothetical protein
LALLTEFHETLIPLLPTVDTVSSDGATNLNFSVVAVVEVDSSGILIVSAAEPIKSANTNPFRSIAKAVTPSTENSKKQPTINHVQNDA